MAIDTSHASPVAISPSQLLGAITTSTQADRPLCVWGKPGIGKTAIPLQWAAQHGYAAHVLRTSTMEPTDLNALMYADPTTGQARFSPHPVFSATTPTLLILDEVNRAPRMVLNALLGLTGPHPRIVGMNTLPTQVRIVATANYEASTGTASMGDALSWRFTHVDVETSFADWQQWATTNQLDAGLIAYLSSVGQPHFYAYDPAERASATAS